MDEQLLCYFRLFCYLICSFWWDKDFHNKTARACLCEGTVEQPVTLRLMNESTWINSSTVRLVDGETVLEGRLEVRPTENDTWGTVCNKVELSKQHSARALFVCFLCLFDVQILFTVTHTHTHTHSKWAGTARLSTSYALTSVHTVHTHTCSHISRNISKKTQKYWYKD